MSSFLTGIAAGYGIAIPVGAIAILIVEVGVKCGFRCAFFAGAGAATADSLYAMVAVLGGAALAGLVEAVDRELRIGSAIVLAVIAVVGLQRARERPEIMAMASFPDRRELLGTYARFVGLTIINPTTIIYFAAVITGLGVADDMSIVAGGLFAVGAFLASLSWQTVLAASGAFAGNRLDDRVQAAAVVVGNLVILVFAIAILIR
jgi:arginine exporter protein ArgO